MSNSYRRPDYAPITTGLEEFSAVRGLADQRLETISEADRLLVGEASSSIPNATAYEILCGINHVRVATGNVQTFIFPAAPIGVCVEGTSMRPTIVQQYYNEPKPANNKNNKREQTPLIIDAAQLDAGSVKFGANPLERLRNMVRRAIEKEYENGGRDKTQHLAETLGVVNATNLPSELATLALRDRRVAELLPEDARERIQTYLLKLPSTLFQTTDGVGFVEHMARQRLRHVLELGDLLLEGEDRLKLDNFSIESIERHLGDLSLAEVADVLGTDQAKKVAFTYDCPECGINSTSKVAHYIMFDGTIQKSSGVTTEKMGKRPSMAGCKMLGSRVDSTFSRDSILATPIREMMRAGFMLSGAGIYGALKSIFDDGSTTLGVANYKPARGTVTALSKMWRGPMYITTRARIYRDGHIASYPELQEYLRGSDQAVGKFMDFARSIPILAEGPELRFDLD